MDTANQTLLPDTSICLTRLKIVDQSKFKTKSSMLLTWCNISAYLPAKKESYLSKFKPEHKSQVELVKPQNKIIINNVDGLAKPKEILAIMGASGAGKTTLLNILNFRNRGALEIEGEVRVNGQLIRSVSEIAKLSGYVQQDDLFIDSLTVKEHLIFQAMLRMDRKLVKSERLNRVEEVMFDLNLKKCENTLIGSEVIKGISGGEKRRLAFASEVLTNPSILYCDEPTSGLDSYMAVSVMESMKNLAQQGKTIVCTIHQPSSEIFEMFDRLCLLAEGQLAYIGSALGAQEFFDTIGYKVPANYNPADFYIKKLAVIPSDKENCLIRIKNICDSFDKSDEKKELKIQLNSASDSQYEEVNFSDEIRDKSSFFTQMKWLLWRNWISFTRNPFAFRVQVIQAFMISILFGLIYFRLELNQNAVINMNGVLFLCLVNNSFGYVFSVVNIFTGEIPIFLREHQNRMYRVKSYYLAKTIIDIPIYIFLPVIFMCIVYWMANLNNDIKKFLICVSIIVIVVQASVSFGTFLSICAPSTNVAVAIAGPALVPYLIFSGFLIKFSDVPNYFLILRYISWFGYANEALQVNQWYGVKNLTCSSNDCLQIFTDGDSILEYLDMHVENFWTDIVCLLILTVGWRLLGYIVLLIKSKQY